MIPLLRLALLLCLAVSTFASESHADPIQVSFSGVIDSVTDPGGDLPGGIMVGTPFSGTFVLDSVPAGPPTIPFPQLAIYPSDPSSSIDVLVGGNLFSESGLPVFIFNDLPEGPGVGPFDSWSTGADPAVCGCIAPTVELIDSTQTRFTDTSYFVNTSLAGWETSRLDLAIGDFDTVIASGVITSLQVVPAAAVPASSPGGQVFLVAFLVATGFMALCVTRRA
jgi:hypothetical protein